MNSSKLKSFTGIALQLGTALALLAFLSGMMFAQEVTGSIHGTVTDPTGATIPNAKVIIGGGALPSTITLTTDSTGTYTMQAVPVGTTYSIAVTATGFAGLKKTDIAVILGRQTRVDFKLEVGAVTESVVVAGDAIMVDTTSSQSAVNVDKAFFDLIPKGRSFYSLVGMAPGARDETKSGGYQVDGASGSENTFYLDGMEVEDIRTGTLVVNRQVPVEMIQQVQIKNGVMEAQYGGAMGGVVNAVVRSGTNEFHGQAGIYFNNDTMQARPRGSLQLNAFNEDVSEYFMPTQDSYQTLNPIFSIGGPIVKNKLFFFAGYMPTWTNTDRTVNFNTGDVGTYHQKAQNNYSTGKVDYLPFSKIRISANWIWDPSYNRGVLPNRNGTDAYDTTDAWGNRGDYTAGNILSGQIDYLATSKLIVSFRGGYNFSNYTNMYAVPSATGIYYSGASSTFPPAALQAPNGWVNQAVGAEAYDKFRRTNLNADASYIFNWHGQHSLKGGWQANMLSDDIVNSSYAHGYYRYYWDTSYSCITDQCSGKQRGTQGYYRYRELGTIGVGSSNNQALFLQDNWRVNKYLSVNLGIRTEREFVPSFVSAIAPAPSPAITFDWTQKMSPRLGFAWDPMGDGKQKVYASWGYFYDIMKYELPRGSFGGDIWKEYYYGFDDPNVVNTNQGFPTDPRGLPGRLLEVVDWRIPSNDPSDNLLQPGLKPMKQKMLDIGYEYSFTNTFVGSARYTDRRLINTIEDIGFLGPNGEQYYIGNPGSGTVADPKQWAYWMGPNVPVTPHAIRDYDALEVRLDKRFSRNYQFSASYLWSRSWGNYSGLASSDENGRNSPNVNRFFDMPWYNYTQNGVIADGLLGTDRPHTFKFFGTYSLHSKLGVTSFSPTGAFYSGTPITTAVNVISSTAMMPYGRGDMGRTPFYSNFDFNVAHEFVPLKSHESIRFRVELSVFNLFNQGTVTDKFSQYIHATDGYIQFQDAEGNNDFASVFGGGWDAKTETLAQYGRYDPRYTMPSAFQAPRSLRMQFSFYF